jgi:hypothetical protein
MYLNSTAFAPAFGVITYDYRQGPMFYHTGTPNQNWTADFTNIPLTYLSSQALAQNNYNGFMVEIKIAATLGVTGYYPNAVRISGAAQTLALQGTTVSVSRLNVWTFNLFYVSGTWVKVALKNVEAF